MMADPDLGPRLIEPLKSQGVTEIDDSALIIRVKFMCLPREQFILRREAYKRIKACFEANSIEFARRKVEVHAPAAAPAQQDGPGAAASEPAA
jgi:small-conductance mechanosensitive channel